MPALASVGWLTHDYVVIVFLCAQDLAKAGQAKQWAHLVTVQILLVCFLHNINIYIWFQQDKKARMSIT